MNTVPATSKGTPLTDAIIEVVYAGHRLAQYPLVLDGPLTQCVCGVSSADPCNPKYHSKTCNVGDYYAKVEAVTRQLETLNRRNSVTIIPVTPNDAQDALIYRDGILDYDAHDAYLRSLGYEYLSLQCSCGGSEDDGHLPTCGWGKPLAQPAEALRKAGL